VVCEAGDIIPADGEVTEGIASVDESAITGNRLRDPGKRWRPFCRYRRDNGNK
jgi:high-affinity K+ transport system ATPase subunit B